MSFSAVVRESMEKYFRKTPPTRLPWQGIINDPGSLADSLDTELADNWADAIDRDH